MWKGNGGTEFVKTRSIFVRLVILEVLANLLLAAIATWSYINKQVVFLDISVALALIMFLSTVAYYQFIIEKGGKDDNTVL